MATSEWQSNQGGRPAGITCPHYEAIPGKKHCRHYLGNGGCSRPDEFMCSEWLKANGHHAATPAEPSAAAPGDSVRQALASSPLDLFGNPNPDYQPRRSKRATAHVEPSQRREKSESVPSPATSTGRSDTAEPPTNRGLTTEDIDSFKALRVEVCISTEACGEVWLVPEYTGRDRKEITPEHAATLCRVTAAFPGSRVVSFEKTPKSDEETPS